LRGGELFTGKFDSEFTVHGQEKKPQKEIRKNKIIKSTFEVNEKALKR
jgi:hypothetical protein